MSEQRNIINRIQSGRRRWITGGISALGVSGLVLGGLAGPAGASPLLSHGGVSHESDGHGLLTGGDLHFGVDAGGHDGDETFTSLFDLTSGGLGTWSFPSCDVHVDGSIFGHLGLGPWAPTGTGTGLSVFGSLLGCLGGKGDPLPVTGDLLPHGSDRHHAVCPLPKPGPPATTPTTAGDTTSTTVGVTTPTTVDDTTPTTVDDTTPTTVGDTTPTTVGDPAAGNDTTPTTVGDTTPTTVGDPAAGNDTTPTTVGDTTPTTVDDTTPTTVDDTTPTTVDDTTPTTAGDTTPTTVVDPQTIIDQLPDPGDQQPNGPSSTTTTTKPKKQKPTGDDNPGDDGDPYIPEAPSSTTTTTAKVTTAPLVDPGTNVAGITDQTGTPAPEQVLGGDVERPAPAADPMPAPATLPRTGRGIAGEVLAALALLASGLVLRFSHRRKPAGQR